MIGRLEGLGGRLNFEFLVFLRKIDDTRVRNKAKKKQGKISIFNLSLLRREMTVGFGRAFVYIKI